MAQKNSRKPKILLCTPEITELPGSMGNAANLIQAKAGGLADISAALVEQLHENSDFEFHVVLPKYDKSIKGFGEISQREIYQLKKVFKENNVHLIDHPAFSEAPANKSKVNIYGDDEVHCALKKSLAYQAGVINYSLDDINPDVVHCNDWMTGLIPAAAKDREMKSLFTLHNIFTKKMSPFEIFRDGINTKRLNGNLFFENHPEYIENNFYQNNVDFTTTGIFSSDFFNTVSPTFLEELVRGEFSDKVPKQMREQIMKKYNSGRATGIINAPREEDSPENCDSIFHYNINNIKEGKRKNKTDFQKKMGLRQEPKTPLYLWPHRLDDQKGIEELIPEIQHLVSKFRIQMAFVGDGREKYESALGAISAGSNGFIAYSDFDKSLEEQGLAGADFLLMPSIYEPCGLPQMKAKRFGTLPIVRNTGGLADTVEEFDAYNNRGSGFLFDFADREGFEYAIGNSLEKFYNLPQETKERNLERITKQGYERHNLKNTAEQYLKIYEQLAKEVKS